MIPCQKLLMHNNLNYHLFVCSDTGDAIRFYQCYRCPSYVPDFHGLSDEQIRREFQMVQELLTQDGHVLSMSVCVSSKLTARRDGLIQEANRRNLIL